MKRGDKRAEKRSGRKDATACAGCRIFTQEYRRWKSSFLEKRRWSPDPVRASAWLSQGGLPGAAPERSEWPQSDRGRSGHRADSKQCAERESRGRGGRSWDARRRQCVREAVPDTDILVNNLGFFGPGDILNTDDAQWERYFQVNVMSGVRATRAYIEGMMRRKWGRIVFISSESGLAIPPDMLAYGFTKTAQSSIARGVAKFAAGSGVTVNSAWTYAIRRGALDGRGNRKHGRQDGGSGAQRFCPQHAWIVDHSARHRPKRSRIWWCMSALNWRLPRRAQR